MSDHDIIFRLRALKSTTATLADYRTLLELAANNHVFTTIVPSSGSWYRVRRHTTQNYFNSIKDLWYPPAEAVKSLGRANDIGRPLLYLSENGASALRECDPADGEIFSVLTCNNPPGSSLLLQEIGVLESVKTQGVPVLSTQISNSDHAAHALGYGNAERQRLFRRFFVDLFTKKIAAEHTHEYKPSVALSNLLLSREECDGLAYPALKSALSDINIAIKPSSADKKFQATSVDVVRVKRTSDGDIAITLLARAEYIDAIGTISYRNAERETQTLPWIDSSRPLLEGAFK